MVRSDIRTRVRDYLHEPVAKIFSDTQLDRYFREELLSLPTKGIYNQYIWSTTVVKDQQSYSLPSGTKKVEYVEINYGGISPAHWSELLGVQKYADKLILPYVPGNSIDQLQVWMKKAFTTVTDDTTALDIPEDKSEVLVWGIVIRGYKQLIGYYRNAKNFDAVTMPNGVTLSVIQGWMRDGKQEYEKLIAQYSDWPRPGTIDLVS